jgi:hypothetical protein
VWVPDGFSFSEIESNLPVPEAPTEELVVRMIGRGAPRGICTDSIGRKIEPA